MARYCARPGWHPPGCDCAVYPHHVGGETRPFGDPHRPVGYPAGPVPDGMRRRFDPNNIADQAIFLAPIEYHNHEGSTAMTDVDMVNHPPHYRHPSGIECITITRQCHGDMAAAIQYIWRYADKGSPMQDLQKAAWYMRDILNNGLASTPPHKARVLLYQVVDYDTANDGDQVRAGLLHLIASGRLDWAINRITEITLLGSGHPDWAANRIAEITGEQS
jgi:Protein of unknwon function (DUF3310)